MPDTFEQEPRSRHIVVNSEGNTDLVNVKVGDTVLAGPENGRKMERPAEQVVTADHQPLADPEFANGVTTMLDGKQAIRLNGELLGIEPPTGYRSPEQPPGNQGNA